MRVGWVLSCLGLGVGAVLLAARPAESAEPGKRALDLADYYRLETVANPALSPDGSKVALVRTYVVEGENRRQSEIWLAPSDGSAPPVRLTHPAFSSNGPRFSPDGSLLAFSSQRKVPGAPARTSADEESSIWFLRMDQPAGEAFRIEGVGGAPVFSPDGRWIAFTKKAPPPSRAPAPPGDPFERLVQERFKGRIYDWMNYRFDGRGYLPDPRDPAATPPEELFIVPREGGAPRQLTRLGVNVQHAAWRPDSRGLVVVADQTDRDEHSYGRADLWLVPLEGEPRRLTDDGYDHAAPVFSPDGRSLVFRREMGLGKVIEAGQGRGAPADLYQMSAEGGPLENLTADWDLIPGDPTFSADGRFVYFGAGVGGDIHLFRAAVEGGARVEPVTHGARRLAGFSFSADRTRVAYTATDPTHPAEAFSARIGGEDERRLSGFNDALLREVDLRPAERLACTSRDGTPVEGWIVLPRGYDPKASYPLVVNIHGGPHGAYGTDFGFAFQLLAARGYAVLYTNPRGSSGYGERFLWATWGGWGILDSEDVLAAADAAIKKYAIDDKRLGVAGYSYGGFLVNWLIGHTTRFAAAVAGAGVSNWVSDYGTSDIPRTKESEFYGPPWDAKSRELMVKLSPVHYAAAVRTPTLFVHGESDLRVPIGQAEEMYLALRKRHVPARFVRYPDSYHGNWAPWNAVHRQYQELRWWDEHLAAGTTATATR